MLSLCSHSLWYARCRAAIVMLLLLCIPVPILAAGGSVVVWGEGPPISDVPPPNTDFTAVDGGGYHSVGLRADGSVAAWGYNAYGQCNVPVPNTGFTAVSAGTVFSAGLKSDGSIVVWGSNGNGEHNVPAPNTGFTAISAGANHVLGLKSDGSIVAWGDNSAGQCNVPEPNTAFTAISAGGYHSLALKSDGSIVAWGGNGWGQCNLPSPSTGFTAVSAGYLNSMALKADGSVVAWGYNMNGQCNVPEPNSGFTATSAGQYHSLGLKADGSIVGWGDDGHGQCNVPEPNRGFRSVSTGFYHSLGVRYPDPVATPSFSPDGGTAEADRSVTVTCSTPGATIHYTTNGVDPLETDPVVTPGVPLFIPVNPPTTLKARAFKSGMEQSAVKEAVYRYVTVIHVKTDGDDANDGLTWGTAKRTIGAALAAAQTGNEVWVKAGTYAERFGVDSGLTLYGGFAGDEIASDQRHWADNVTIVDGGGDGTVVTTGGPVDGLTIRNGNRGVQILGASVVRNCIVTGNSEFGLFFDNHADGTAANNIIKGNGLGIRCYNSSPAITNNTISGNGRGLSCVYSTSPISNNIVAFNGAGISSAEYAPVLKNNCFYNPGGDNYHDLTPGEGDISADPKFESAMFGRLRVQADSPCVNAGLDSAVHAGWTDIDGQARIQGTHVDIGADESDGTTWPEYEPTAVRVSTSGVDDAAHDGSTWALAKRTVQAGIDAATSEGREVWVAAGTYAEHVNLRPYVHVYGGFAGDEEWLSARDWPTNLSIVDGGGTGTVVKAWGYRTGVLDGLTIRNPGSATDNYVIDCTNASPSILNSTIIGSGNYGIYCSTLMSLSNPSIIGNAISGNLQGIRCVLASPRIIGNTITGSTNYGIFCANGSPEISGNTLSGNGGGIYCNYASGPITENTITGNSGCGIYCDGPGSPPITRNAISNNGTGIHFYYAASVVSNNLITGNHESGVYCFHGGAVITNNIITGNNATYGGGVYCIDCNPVITNNTIYGNSAWMSGGGISIHDDASPNISNNIIMANTGGGIDAFYCVAGPYLRNNCLYANDYDYRSIAPGYRDISMDPAFIDHASGDFHLLAGSACIDAGWNNAQNLASVDIDGQDRLMGAAVDIGADEYSGPTPESVSILDARLSPVGRLVRVNGAIVSAAWPDVFYIEADDRSCGIRVEKTTHGQAQDTRSDVIGTISTREGERYIEATIAYLTGTGEVRPLGIAGPALSGAGLDNIGLLVRTWGKVTRKGTGYLYVDDGSALSDGTATGTDPNAGVRVICDPTAFAVGDLVEITGISSCFDAGEGRTARRILTRTSDGIRNIGP